MAISDLFRPRWRHSNSQERLDALRELKPSETDILCQILREDPAPEVRAATIELLHDLDLIRQFCGQSFPDDTPARLVARRNQLLHERLLHPAAGDDLPALLAELDDPQLLADLAVRLEDSACRLAAVRRLDDQDLLARVLTGGCGKEASLLALERLTREDLLAKVAANAGNKTLRAAAEAKLAALRPPPPPPPGPSPEELLDGKLQALCLEVERLVPDAPGTPAALAEFERLWQELPGSAAHPRQARFLELSGRIRVRLAELEQQRQQEREAAECLRQAVQAREGLAEQVLALARPLDPECQKTFAEIQAAWAELPPLPAPLKQEWDARFETAKTCFRRLRGQAEAELEVQLRLEALAAEAEAGLREGQLEAADAAIHKGQALPLPAAPKHVDFAPAQARLQAVLDSILLQRRQTAAEREAQLAATRTQLEALVAQVGAAMEVENHAEAEKAVKAAEESCKALGPETADPAARHLRQEFDKLCKKFHQRQYAWYKERELERWANKAAKEELIRQAAALDSIPELEQLFGLLRELQGRWKEVGPVPREDADALWAQFHSACERQYERCKPYLDGKAAERQEAFTRKQALAQEAATLAESTEWNVTAERLKAIQQEWKQLGQVPWRQERELFQQLRQACNQFFSRRQEHQEALRGERAEHLGRKQALCDEAIALAKNPRREDVARVKQLQAEWKQVGAGPRKEENSVWESFHRACNEFFQALDQDRLAHAARKQELCVELEALLAAPAPENEQNALAAKIGDLQRRWKEIGPAPREQEESLWQRFHGPCDQFFRDRHAVHERQQAERQAHREAKEALLARVSELASRIEDKAAVEEIKSLQARWKEIGPAPREAEQALWRRFHEACNAFFEGRHDFFQKLDEQRQDSLRRKEEICARIEALAGAPSHGGGHENRALSLAEELRIALEANWIRGERPDNNRAQAVTEVRRLQQEWEDVGPLRGDDERRLWRRLQKALDQFFGSGERGPRHGEGRHERRADAPARPAPSVPAPAAPAEPAVPPAEPAAEAPPVGEPPPPAAEPPAAG